ncbi:MAG: type II secretion system protein [Granulosicoccus sp.]
MDIPILLLAAEKRHAEAFNVRSMTSRGVGPYRRHHFQPMPGAALSKGFTLVELAIVMVIVGLIMGGIFKGQSLIDSARVRSISTEIAGIQTAWFSFQERYRSLPGDFQNASAQIDSAATPGDGNGRIDDSRERAGVWQQLSLAGLISGNYDGAQSAAGSANDVACNPSTCPQNPFNGFYKITYSAQAVGVDGPANEMYTGAQIPVNILSQLDSRLDDGLPNSGRFRVHRAFSGTCTRDGNWDLLSENANCAAVLRD